jgi:hypothetical protein
MNRNFARYRFTATLLITDTAVLHCLRGLAHWAQRGEPHQQIAWGGCGEKEWQSRGGQVKFRFTSPERRAEWLGKSAQLLGDRWTLISTRDDDPAFPTNLRHRLEGETARHYRPAVRDRGEMARGAR